MRVDNVLLLICALLCTSCSALKKERLSDANRSTKSISQQEFVEFVSWIDYYLIQKPAVFRLPQHLTGIEANRELSLTELRALISEQALYRKYEIGLSDTLNNPDFHDTSWRIADSFLKPFEGKSDFQYNPFPSQRPQSNIYTFLSHFPYRELGFVLFRNPKPEESVDFEAVFNSKDLMQAAAMLEVEHYREITDPYPQELSEKLVFSAFSETRTPPRSLVAFLELLLKHQKDELRQMLPTRQWRKIRDARLKVVAQQPSTTTPTANGRALFLLHITQDSTIEISHELIRAILMESGAEQWESFRQYMDYARRNQESISTPSHIGPEDFDSYEERSKLRRTSLQVLNEIAGSWRHTFAKSLSFPIAHELAHEWYPEVDNDPSSERAADVGAYTYCMMKYGQCDNSLFRKLVLAAAQHNVALAWGPFSPSNQSDIVKRFEFQQSRIAPLVRTEMRTSTNLFKISHKIEARLSD